MRAFYILILCLLPLTIVGCSKKESPETAEDAAVLQAHAEEAAEKIYQEGMDHMEKKNYSSAVEKFEEVERIYPYTQWATTSKLMAAVAKYRDEEYDDAVTLLDQFIQLHPGNKDVAYAYYLKAMSYYLRIADVARDQQITMLARNSLQEVVARFPESDYARDAKLKLDLVQDHLAGKEMEVGRYYQKQHKWVAAINRFKTVIDNYQTTAHVAEALDRLVECYLAMGIEQEAVKYAAVLGHNFPGSKWYEHSYQLLKGKTMPEEQESEEWFKDLITKLKP